MLNAKKILKFALSLVFFLLVSIIHTQAQYYPGYGRGGYGGYGGMNRYGSDFDNPKPKAPLDPDEVAKEETKWMVKKLKHMTFFIIA